MSRQRTVIVITAIVALAAYGVSYLLTVTDPAVGVVTAVIAGIAGLGGYEVKQRAAAAGGDA